MVSCAIHLEAFISIFLRKAAVFFVVYIVQFILKSLYFSSFMAIMLRSTAKKIATVYHSDFHRHLLRSFNEQKFINLVHSKSCTKLEGHRNEKAGHLAHQKSLKLTPPQSVKTPIACLNSFMNFSQQNKCLP